MDATRDAGLARLHQFIPRMGRAYAAGRNFDPGPEARRDVSALSPYIRRRLVTEQEVVAAAREAHGEGAGKFVQEVFWRTYFNGFLEQHPAIWQDYRMAVGRDHDRLAVEGGLRTVFHDATEGRTGIDCFDTWARELVAENWLHNHVRMWFASIWIFTLRLPWSLGADFFARHLLDGDPASNTLSWRWVAGLHTRGKHYVARAENIARYTQGRFDPRGQLDETPEPLTEDLVAPTIKPPEPDTLPEGEVALLLHDDDFCPETLLLARVGRVGVLACPGGFAQAGAADPVRRFVTDAAADTAQRAERLFAAPVSPLTPDDLAGWVAASDLPVVTPYAPLGPVADILAGLPVARLQRPWDRACWPHARRGFFQLKDRIPAILADLGAG